MTQQDEFREDLYFRINTFEIRLPPLRERRPDIPDLARHLLARAAKRPVEQVADLLTPEAVDTLLEHEWPGNVRELANVMEHAWILAGGKKNPAEAGPGQYPPRRRPADVAAAAAAGARRAERRPPGTAHTERDRDGAHHEGAREAQGQQGRRRRRTRYRPQDAV